MNVAAVHGLTMNSNPAKTRRLGAASASEAPLSRGHPNVQGVAFWSNPFRALWHSKVNPAWLAVPFFGFFVEAFAFTLTPEQLDRSLNMIVRYDQIVIVN